MILTPEEWQALLTSLTVAGRALAFALPLAVLVAWLLARPRLPGRFVLNALAHAPLVLPPVVVGYALLLLFGVKGPAGHVLYQTLHIRLAFTGAGASLAAGVMAFPLMVRALRLAFEAIDPGLDVAARSLGADALDRFLNVSLPLAAPGVAAAAIVGFAACLGEFGAIITFAANVPGETQTLPLAIYAALQTPGGDAAALKLSLLSFAIAMVALALSEVLARRAQRLAGR
ncbi:MAG: molybdate transporter permease [Caulobacteraceae bacterium]|jgi:molybdate transport system permease protein|nr:molybdate transporter permease [Caulobacteraceae bacterium]